MTFVVFYFFLIAITQDTFERSICRATDFRPSRKNFYGQETSQILLFLAVITKLISFFIFPKGYNYKKVNSEDLF